MSTAAQQRDLYRARKEAGLCANAATHGPATRGTECEACWQRRADKRAAARMTLAEVATMRRELAALRTEMDAVRRSLDKMRRWGRP